MHVAVEIGFWSHPWTLDLCQKTSCALAGTHVLRLRELVLSYGTAEGRLPDHSLAEIATACHWRGTPSQFARLMRHWIGHRRGCWYYVDWKKTAGGRYAALKEWDRARKLEERRAAKAAALEKIKNGGGSGGESEHGQNGHPLDKVRTSAAHPPDIGIKKERKLSRGARNFAPVAPEGGVRDAMRFPERWEWFERNYPKLSDPDACKRMLDRLTVPEWEHLYYALPKLAAGIYLRKGYRWVPYADKFLRKKAFVEIAMPNPDELRTGKEAAKAAKKATPKLTHEQEVAARKAAAESFLLEKLRDPEMAAAEKEKARSKWEKNWHTKPWEVSK